MAEIDIVVGLDGHRIDLRKTVLGYIGVVKAAN
jgi:hypothetical protein